jgi:hypothetical protein
MSDYDAARHEPRRRSRGVSRLELVVAGLGLIALIVLVALEPDILEAPFASWRSLVASVGGVLLAAVALAVMLRLAVPPLARVLVIGIPFLVASWWLVEPYFVDDVVDEAFSGSIEQQRPSTTVPTGGPVTTGRTGPSVTTPAPTVATTLPTGPRLIASGSFVGLAGHDGTGDAGLFRLADGTLALRLENFDIDNGPDLELYLVPGEQSYSPRDGALHLGALKGNKGNQTYEIPNGFSPAEGPWTVLVWCRAFSVEFVGATILIA